MDVVAESSAPSGPEAGRVHVGTTDQLKSITIHYEENEDSEPFPWNLRVGNISDLKRELLEILGLDVGSKNVVVILEDHKIAITNIELIVDRAAYVLKFKGKAKAVELYLARRAL